MSNSTTMAEITQWMNTKLNKKKKERKKETTFKKNNNKNCGLDVVAFGN